MTHRKREVFQENWMVLAHYAYVECYTEDWNFSLTNHLRLTRANDYCVMLSGNQRMAGDGAWLNVCLLIIRLNPGQRKDSWVSLCSAPARGNEIIARYAASRALSWSHQPTVPEWLPILRANTNHPKFKGDPRDD
jgi:hypothetical protein